MTSLGPVPPLDLVTAAEMRAHAARRTGRIGLIANDLVERLPSARAKLGA